MHSYLKNLTKNLFHRFNRQSSLPLAIPLYDIPALLNPILSSNPNEVSSASLAHYTQFWLMRHFANCSTLDFVDYAYETIASIKKSRRAPCLSMELWHEIHDAKLKFGHKQWRDLLTKLPIDLVDGMVSPLKMRHRHNMPRKAEHLCFQGKKRFWKSEHGSWS